MSILVKHHPLPQFGEPVQNYPLPQNRQVFWICMERDSNGTQIRSNMVFEFDKVDKDGNLLFFNQWACNWPRDTPAGNLLPATCAGTQCSFTADWYHRYGRYYLTPRKRLSRPILTSIQTRAYYTRQLICIYENPPHLIFSLDNVQKRIERFLGTTTLDKVQTRRGIKTKSDIDLGQGIMGLRKLERIHVIDHSYSNRVVIRYRREYVYYV